jgi:hypothetical protein
MWIYFIRDIDLNFSWDIEKFNKEVVNLIDNIIDSILHSNFFVDAEIKLLLFSYWVWLFIHQDNVSFLNYEFFCDHFFFLLINDLYVYVYMLYIIIK